MKKVLTIVVLTFSINAFAEITCYNPQTGAIFVSSKWSCPYGWSRL